MAARKKLATLQAPDSSCSQSLTYASLTSRGRRSSSISETSTRRSPARCCKLTSQWARYHVFAKVCMNFVSGMTQQTKLACGRPGFGLDLDWASSAKKSAAIKSRRVTLSYPSIEGWGGCCPPDSENNNPPPARVVVPPCPFCSSRAHLPSLHEGGCMLFAKSTYNTPPPPHPGSRHFGKFGMETRLKFRGFQGWLSCTRRAKQAAELHCVLVWIPRACSSLDASIQ